LSLLAVLAAVVVLVAAVVRVAIEPPQDFLLVDHLPLLLVLVALLVVRVQLILRELEQEPMAAPDQILFFLLLLQ